MIVVAFVGGMFGGAFIPIALVYLSRRQRAKREREVFKSITIIDANGKPIQTIKALRAWVGYGLREAKEAIDLHKPVVIREDFSKYLIEELDGLGVSMRITSAKDPSR